MRIDAIILRELQMPLVRPFETSFGITSNRRILLVEIQSEGLSGWGECTAGERPFFSAESTDTAWAVITQELGPMLNSEHPEHGGHGGHFQPLVSEPVASWQQFVVPTRRPGVFDLHTARHLLGDRLLLPGISPVPNRSFLRLGKGGNRGSRFRGGVFEF